jgi:superoxide dismutase, Cu-Zn family
MTLGGTQVRRITKAALGGLAGCALVLGGTQVASGDLLDLLDGLKVHKDSGDFLTSTEQPLDSAKAKITIDKGTNGTTTFSIRVTGIDTSIDPSIVGRTLGAHLHTGQCVEGDAGNPSATPSIGPGPQAGPHYNHDRATGATTVRISRETEVWFDLVPNADGMAYDKTTVPFVPVDDGVMSVVVHVKDTNPVTGGAGDRQACFPLSVSGIFPEPSPTE